jgi:N-carbamoyl-L-amino-acid hydrolase
MALRQDPLAAAAAAVLALREAAVQGEGLATVGTFAAEPGPPTAVPARVRFVVDVRHAHLEGLVRLDTRARDAAKAAAEAEGCSVETSPVWEIDPLPFDRDLVARASELTGGGEPLTSGPLHDAAAACRAGIPTAMIFVRTRGGVSHTREEDAADADLAVGIEALIRLVAEVSGSTLA